MISEENIRREYVTALEAAQLIGVNDSRIRQICIEGKFEGAFKLGETWLIPRKSVLRYMPGRRGPKPRIPKGETDRDVINNALKEADNLKKEETDNDKQ